MMDTLWFIRKIVITTFKDYKNWLLFIALPLVAVVFAIYTQGGTEQSKMEIAIINDDNGHSITIDTIDYITSMDVVQIKEVERSDIYNQIIAGDLDVAITFSEGFAEGIKNNQPIPVQINALNGSEAAGYINLNLNHYIDNLSMISKIAGTDDNKFNDLYNTVIHDHFPFITEQVEDRSIDYRQTNQTIGYLLIIMLFSAANLSSILIKEREIRTFYRIMASPIKMSTYVASNIVVNMLVMIIQIVVSLLLLTKVLKINTGISFTVMLLALVIFALVAVSFSFVIVAFTRNKMEANGMQTLFFIPTSILAGCMFPINSMPPFMEKIAIFLPQYWLMEIFTELQNGYILAERYINVMILFAFAIMFVLVSILKFGKSNDTTSHI